MVEIISRGDGPRPEDARLKAFLEQNRPTITKLADHLTQGGYSASRRTKKAAPEAPERTIIHAVGGLASGQTAEPRPVVRASVNGRVIVVDDNSGRQLSYLGEIRRSAGELLFVLASAENGFAASADAATQAALGDLDRARLAPDGGEEALVKEIALRLGVE